MVGLESSIIDHNVVITLAFTLALILSTAVLAFVTYLSVKEIQKQLLFQEWICLKNIVHNNQITIFGLQATDGISTDPRQGTAIDAAIAKLNHDSNQTNERIQNLETILKMK